MTPWYLEPLRWFSALAITGAAIAVWVVWFSYFSDRVRYSRWLTAQIAVGMTFFAGQRWLVVMLTLDNDGSALAANLRNGSVTAMFIGLAGISIMGLSLVGVLAQRSLEDAEAKRRRRLEQLVGDP